MEIREARKEDCKDIDRMIRELAVYEKMPDGPNINHEVLERDGFEKDPPLFKAFVAVDNEKTIGYALYYYTYCTWQGKSMFLEDFYITPEYRNRGIGGRMFDIVAKKAAKEDCRRLDFEMLDWNPARSMYVRKGAVDLTNSSAWHLFRLDGQELAKYRDS